MKFLTISGIILFIVTLFSFNTTYEKFRIGKNGHIVKMLLETLPQSCIGSKVPYFITLSYKGKTYERKTRGDFCDKHHIGELIDIKMLEDSKYIMFPRESGLFDLISLVVLNFFGLLLAAIQWRKIKRET